MPTTKISLFLKNSFLIFGAFSKKMKIIVGIEHIAVVIKTGTITIIVIIKRVPELASLTTYTYSKKKQSIILEN